MSLFIASLNSGSNGNCYYIGNESEAVLIDAGISCRETERRMLRLGLPMTRVQAVFVTHEHDDHIRGLDVLSQRYGLPVFITEPTLQQCRLPPAPRFVRAFTADEPVTIGGLKITAFSKTHDASDPYSFTVSSTAGSMPSTLSSAAQECEVRVGIFTDIGAVCDNVVRHFTQCHAAFLEANYDEQLLLNGAYPWPLKNRIRGGQGHLSNLQALELFVNYRPGFMSHLLLAHLSQDNNRPELVQTLFEREAHGTTVVVASRYAETEVYAIDGGFTGKKGNHWTPNCRRLAAPAAPVLSAARPAPKPAVIQTRLF
jgi:phosphoribosyl 1,2-cyclic phosphodiesterase